MKRMGWFPVFISLFYLVGFGILAYSVVSAWRSTRAGGWPSVDGTVAKLNLKEDHSDGASYQVEVEYTYKVDRQEYRSSRLAYGYGASSGREAHAAIYDKLKAAKTVEVRYDPDDPATSVLSFGFHRSIQLALTFAIVWLAFTFGFTLLTWLFSRGDDVLLRNLSVN